MYFKAIYHWISKQLVSAHCLTALLREYKGRSFLFYYTDFYFIIYC